MPGVKLRVVDIKPTSEWYQLHPESENIQADLKDLSNCRRACENATDVYNLACDMGGMGFIENNRALCMLSVLVNTHMLIAAREAGVGRYFYSSSACVYNADKQKSADVVALKEEDAYPAMPEDGYGWEKLFSERIVPAFPRGFWRADPRCALSQRLWPARHMGRRSRKGSSGNLPQGDRSRQIRRSRDRNLGRRPADAKLHVYRRLHRRNRKDHGQWNPEPINLGSSELVTINQLVDIVEQIANVKLKRRYNLSAPKGVNGRNSDNTLIQSYLGWEPSIPLRAGLEKTYDWILDEYTAKYGAASSLKGALVTP